MSIRRLAKIAGLRPRVIFMYTPLRRLLRKGGQDGKRPENLKAGRQILYEVSACRPSQGFWRPLIKFFGVIYDCITSDAILPMNLKIPVAL